MLEDVSKNHESKARAYDQENQRLKKQSDDTKKDYDVLIDSFRKTKDLELKSMSDKLNDERKQKEKYQFKYSNLREHL